MWYSMRPCVVIALSAVVKSGGKMDIRASSGGGMPCSPHTLGAGGAEKRERDGWCKGRGVGKAGHAVAILDATVRSLSSFALFFSNACCLQLSRFWHSWCSGIRCCRTETKDESDCFR